MVKPLRARCAVEPARRRQGEAWNPSHILGVAMVSHGYWALNLVRNFADLDSAWVVSVSDLDPEKLTLVRRRHAGVKVTTESRGLLTDPWVDAVAIATRLIRIYQLALDQLALAALKAGKHVLVKKPLARTSMQSPHLIE